MSLKILVTGSRNIIDKEWIIQSIKAIVHSVNADTIIHGGAIGVDTCAHEFCEKYFIEEEIVRPVREDIPTYYLHRNAEMVGMCDMVIAFWDGKSRGTKFTIDYAKARDKTVVIRGLIK